jgi:hypothetical protein
MLHSFQCDSPYLLRKGTNVAIIIEHKFYKKRVNVMDLVEVGIVLKCLCGAGMNADIADVLFDDRGRVKIGHRPVHCPVCGAIYRHGERVKYELAPLDIKMSEGRRMKRSHLNRQYTRQNHLQCIEVTLSG